MIDAGLLPVSLVNFSYIPDMNARVGATTARVAPKQSQTLIQTSYHFLLTQGENIDDMQMSYNWLKWTNGR